MFLLTIVPAQQLEGGEKRGGEHRCLREMKARAMRESKTGLLPSTAIPWKSDFRPVCFMSVLRTGVRLIGLPKEFPVLVRNGGAYPTCCFVRGEREDRELVAHTKKTYTHFF